jgi:hypothetical protein
VVVSFIGGGNQSTIENLGVIGSKLGRNIFLLEFSTTLYMIFLDSIQKTNIVARASHFIFEKR